MQKKYKIIAFQAFAMYFLTGAACMLVGSSLPHLVKLYGLPINQVVLMGSAYALGRVATVYLTGRLVEKIGPIRVLFAGTVLVALFLAGIPALVNFYAGMFFAVLGGIGMGAQDTVCPLLLSVAFRKHYAASLSAGQALFGLGGFATPFLIGLMLMAKRDFYLAYYILCAAAVLMLVTMPFVGTDIDREINGEKEPEEKIKPLYAVRQRLVWISILIICAAYSAIVNTLSLYISSFAESIGISQTASAFLLTVYNIGCVGGSVAFIWVLKKVSAQKVLTCNLICSLIAVTLAFIINQAQTYFIFLAVAGFFLGVLFSVIITIATRIGYEHISRASSVVATASGFSDILTPVVTGALVGLFGISVSFYYTIGMILICLAAALVILFATSDEKTGGTRYGNSK